MKEADKSPESVVNVSPKPFQNYKFTIATEKKVNDIDLDEIHNLVDKPEDAVLDAEPAKVQAETHLELGGSIKEVDESENQDAAQPVPQS